MKNAKTSSTAIDYRFTDLDGAARKRRLAAVLVDATVLGRAGGKDVHRDRLCSGRTWAVADVGQHPLALSGSLLLLALSAIIVMSGRFWNNYQSTRFALGGGQRLRQDLLNAQPPASPPGPAASRHPPSLIP